MPGSRKILLITEGAKAEPRFLRALISAYGLSGEYRVYSYNTVVHDLYERLFESGDEAAALDLLLVLRSREQDPERRRLLTQDYTDVLLVFDYDPQDDRFSARKLEVMMQHFDDSTDNGKLYLNYPMLESYRHIRSLPDEGYLDRCVSLEDIAGYKAESAR